jgi:hypothetical protein
MCHFCASHIHLDLFTLSILVSVPRIHDFTIYDNNLHLPNKLSDYKCICLFPFRERYEISSVAAGLITRGKRCGDVRINKTKVWGLQAGVIRWSA